jgi:hypothetical protein
MNGDEIFECGYEEEKTDENTGERKMVKCSMRYKSQRGRIVHIKEQHDRVRHMCPLLTCQKVYTRKMEMRKHFSKKHPSLNFDT